MACATHSHSACRQVVETSNSQSDVRGVPKQCGLYVYDQSQPNLRTTQRTQCLILQAQNTFDNLEQCLLDAFATKSWQCNTSPRPAKQQASAVMCTVVRRKVFGHMQAQECLLGNAVLQLTAPGWHMSHCIRRGSNLPRTTSSLQKLRCCAACRMYNTVASYKDVTIDLDA